MPPNKAIEAELRAYAESRRLQAPPDFELDMPSRRRLQEEVERVYRTEPSSGAARRAWLLWIRVGLASAAAAVVLFVSVQFLPREEPMLLSRSAERVMERAGRPAEPAASEASDQLRDAFSLEVAGVPPARAPELAETVARSAAKAAPTAPRVTAPAESRQQSFGATTAARSDDATTGSESARDFQQVQRYRRNPNSPPPPQVLQAFKWIQEGNAIRVIDADGSVYTGTIQVPAAAPEPLMAPTARGATGTTTQSRVTQRQAPADRGLTGERFVISGTNRTMNARVVFEGVLVPASVGQRVTAVLETTAPAGAAGAPVQIQGQAMVGSSTRLEIVAVPRTE